MNQQKTRETLEYAIARADEARTYLLRSADTKACMEELIDKCRAALSEPARNCDVGTADEQGKRSIDYCCSKCDGSNCKHGVYREDELYKCAIKWAQLPYAEEGDNDGR